MAVSVVGVNDIQVLIERYDAAERAGTCFVPNYAIAAFGLETFAEVGYPVRISRSEQLWRYHDVMQDGRFEHNLRLLGDGMDSDGGKLASQAAASVTRFAEARFGFSSAGRDMLSRAFVQYAMLCESLADKPRPWTILEVGPGCGYLGVILGLDGHQYLAVEASQAFFVYQSMLFKDVFGDEYSCGLDESISARIRHLPWWELCRERSSLPALTAVTANHMLAEMNGKGLRFLISKLHQTQALGTPIIADTLGANYVNSEDSVVQTICGLGFSAKETGPHRQWIFTKVDGRGTCERWKPSLGRIVQARAFRLPLIGARLERLAHRMKANEKFEASTASIVRRVLAGFPHVDGADLRFRNGTW